MPVWPHQNDVDNFYGNPRGRDGRPSQVWEKANIVSVPTPWKLVTSWDGATVRGIRVHKKCAESFRIVLEEIWTGAGKSQEKIEGWGMHLFGGGYNFRLMKGGTRLSMHSWGCAVDFDPARNGFGDTTPNFAKNPVVLKAFADQGWTWGGGWTKPDGMHWQAAQI